MDRISARRGALLLAGALTAATFGPAAPARADEVPVVTAVTTENVGGGLTPYVPLYTVISVAFTDQTPSAETDYRLVVDGVGTYDGAWAGPDENSFLFQIDHGVVEPGVEHLYSVEELSGGEVVATSAPQAFTFAYVGHPRRISTSSVKVDGRWTYKVGKKATLTFKGAWEEGTRFSTQVWISRKKRFTPDDWAYNTNGKAIVDTELTRKPVLSWTPPKRARGKWVYVSVLGWKDGEGGWLFTVPAEYVRK